MHTMCPSIRKKKKKKCNYFFKQPNERTHSSNSFSSHDDSDSRNLDKSRILSLIRFAIVLRQRVARANSTIRGMFDPRFTEDTSVARSSANLHAERQDLPVKNRRTVWQRKILLTQIGVYAERG